MPITQINGSIDPAAVQPGAFDTKSKITLARCCCCPDCGFTSAAVTFPLPYDCNNCNVALTENTGTITVNGSAGFVTLSCSVGTWSLVIGTYFHNLRHRPT